MFSLLWMNLVLKDFIGFYDFLRNQANYSFVKAFGMKCHLNRVNELQSGKGLN